MEQKTLGESKSGKHSQSMVPSVPTRAAVYRSPMIPWSSIGRYPIRLPHQCRQYCLHCAPTDRARQRPRWARKELARMTPAQRAAMPAPRPSEEIAGAVVEFIRDENLAGRVMVMWPGEPPRLLD